MKIDDLMKMTVGEVLTEFCVVYSPECDHYYGIARWDDAAQMFDEYDLEDEYCFDGDELIPLDYGFFEGEEVLDLEKLRYILDYLGVEKNDKRD